MTVLEKRKVERSNNILIVSFRPYRESHEYLSGITNNYSIKGISLETGRFEYNPGEVLEIILKHPYSEWSVEAVGEIVWKTDGWYKNISGIKLKDMDREADNRLKELMANAIEMHVGLPLLHEDVELPKEMEQENIVIDETAAKAENIISHENTPSISKEGVELPEEEKAGIDINQYRGEKPTVKIINGIGRALIVFYICFTIVTATARMRGSENDEKTQQSLRSQNASVIQGLPVDKGNAGQDLDQYFITSIPGTGTPSEHIEKAEKSDLSQNAAATQGGPLLRKEIIFDLDSDAISALYRPEIDKFAKALLSEPDAMLKVEGYADSIGAELYNLDLAMRRAWEVKKLLMNRGISDKRIKVTVYGESYPVFSDNEESESPMDRRVELLLISSGNRI